MEILKKDITTVECGIIAHGCNCSGKAYRSGVAGAIRTKWNKAYQSYINIPAVKLTLGYVDVVEINSSLFVLNCLTQQRYGRDGKRYADIDAIETALERVVIFANDNPTLPVYMPQIGCGLGGLDWDTEVGPLVKDIFTFYKINVFVCEI